MRGKRERVKTPGETQDAARPPASGAWTTEHVLLEEERNEEGKERAGIGKERRKETQLCF